MANKIFTQFKNPISSFELREANQGLILPSVYRGYDSIAAAGTSSGVIPIKFIHGETAFKKINNVNNEEADNFGVIVFPNGMVFHDSDEVVLNVPQTGSGLKHHLLYASLDYVEAPGASSVNYSIKVDGFNPFGNPQYVLDNPAVDVPIGLISVVTGTTISSITYTKLNVPSFANASLIGMRDHLLFARRDSANQFTNYNTFIGSMRIRSTYNSDIAERSLLVDGQGYIFINAGDEEAQELILDAGNANHSIYGFRHSSKPFGHGASNIRRGTTIKVRFVNIGSSSTFKKAQTTSVLRGFIGLTHDVPIKDGVLYILRLDEITSGGHAYFSVSPHTSIGEIKNMNTQIAGKYDSNLVVIDDVLHSTPDVVNISMSSFKKGSGTLVHLIAETEPDVMNMDLPNLIPSGFRPKTLVQVNPINNSVLGMIVNSSGDVLINHPSDITTRRTISATWHTGKL